MGVNDLLLRSYYRIRGAHRTERCDGGVLCVLVCLQAEWLMDQWFEWLWIVTLILAVLLVVLLVVAFFKMKTGQAKKDEGDNDDVDPLLGGGAGGKKKTVQWNRSTAKSFVKSVESTCHQGVRAVLSCSCFNAKAGKAVAAVVKKATTKSSENKDSAEDNIASVEMAPIKQVWAAVRRAGCCPPVLKRAGRGGGLARVSFELMRVTNACIVRRRLLRPRR
jgi:hypothetical protein